MEKLFVLALDGVPHSLLKKLSALGHMPHLSELIKEATFREMHSVQPPVSSSAWASFATGCMPPEHGIMGFVDRNVADGKWFLPNAAHLQKPTLWKKLSQLGKRVFVMNVPVTYPPAELNGISICGFLGPDIRQGTYPPQLGTVLKARGYRIDADTELAKTDLNAFYDDLRAVFSKRLETMWEFYGQEQWDFFMVHVMETDRLHHFFWDQFENHYRPDYNRFLDFYRELDIQIGRIIQALDSETAILMLSDHGFTSLRYAVYLNRWLADKGYLVLNSRQPVSDRDLHPGTRAFSMYPGRIYLQVQGRDRNGTVEQGTAYEQLRNELIFGLQQIKDPEGRQVVERVYRGEEIYGSLKTDEQARVPDLMVVSHKGYDLKGDLWHASFFDRTVFTGMHTFDDAFVLARGLELPDGQLSIDRLHDSILNFFV